MRGLFIINTVYLSFGKHHKFKLMKTFLKLSLLGLLISVCSTDLKAQDFPATDKEVGKILCAGKWMLDSVGNDKKMTNSKEAMMDDVKIVFKNDGTYTITMFEMDRVGKWKTSMEEKQVKIYEKKPEPESIVSVVKKEKLVMTQKGEDGFKLIFKLDK